MSETSKSGLQNADKMWVEPLGDELILRIVRTVRTKEGVVLPASHKSNTPMFRVVAVGPEVEDVAPGDLVLPAPRCAAQDVDTDGDEVLTVVRRPDIAARYHNVDMATREEGLSREALQKADEEIKLAAKLADSNQLTPPRRLARGRN